tara:strand:+ start:3254 stop:4630 length:1377 start_codon:yes stop_codon:yes gene_type:complete
MQQYLIYFVYLLCSCLFILGIKGLSHPRTAVKGNQTASIGMLIAVLATLIDQSLLQYEWIIAGMLIGASLGIWTAAKVEITQMPQMVALLNGFGGAASLCVALVHTHINIYTDWVAHIAIQAALLIGAVTFTGSLIAVCKLQSIIPKAIESIRISAPIKFLCFVATLICFSCVVMYPAQPYWLYSAISLAFLLGVLLVISIGGADMPVVIALLNAYSGLAAACTGFITYNTLLIISGSIVGTSGLILTQVMCKAMNRSLRHVLFGLVSRTQSPTDPDKSYEGKISTSSADEVAVILESASEVVIVPGYGLATSQAQHAVKELAKMLESHDINVKYAIHPVAGRMPGHMNVLLAEAEVPYEQLLELEQANPQFKQTDVVIVIGANDVTNPMARVDKTSPIYGMPILDVDQARTVVVIKRSLGAGFAGLPNPLFGLEKTLMLFGDAKETLHELNQSLKQA